jgi:ribosomal-protein-serine acetyltransferase
MFVHVIDPDTELRLLEMRHAPELHAQIMRNRETLRQWLPWIRDDRTIGDTRSFLWATLQQFASNAGIQAGIWHRGELVGAVGNHGINWEHRQTDLGYWLAADSQGKGLMTRACAALIDHAIHDQGLNRVEIRAATGNVRSRAVAERLGFTLEGVIRDGEWLYDHFVDIAVYGLLASEWRPDPEAIPRQ